MKKRVLANHIMVLMFLLAGYSLAIHTADTAQEKRDENPAPKKAGVEEISQKEYEEFRKTPAEERMKRINEEVEWPRKEYEAIKNFVKQPGSISYDKLECVERAKEWEVISQLSRDGVKVATTVKELSAFRTYKKYSSNLEVRRTKEGLSIVLASSSGRWEKDFQPLKGKQAGEITDYDFEAQRRNVQWGGQKGVFIAYLPTDDGEESKRIREKFAKSALFRPSLGIVEEGAFAKAVIDVKSFLDGNPSGIRGAEIFERAEVIASNRNGDPSSRTVNLDWSKQVSKSDDAKANTRTERIQTFSISCR